MVARSWIKVKCVNGRLRYKNWKLQLFERFMRKLSVSREDSAPACLSPRLRCPSTWFLISPSSVWISRAATREISGLVVSGDEDDVRRRRNQHVPMALPSGNYGKPRLSKETSMVFARAYTHTHTHTHTRTRKFYTLHRKHICIYNIYIVYIYRYMVLCTTITGTKRLLKKGVHRRL